VHVDVDEWGAELPLIEEWYAQFGAKLPAQLQAELDDLKECLAKARVVREREPPVGRPGGSRSIPVAVCRLAAYPRK
jgi:hypothetical protein